METARVTARQVAESLSTKELREAAKEFRVKPEEATAEDIAQLLEYIADLRAASANELLAVAAIRKLKGGQQ